jgi:hypothetical protein
MRTKTLFLSAAAMAAGLLTSMAASSNVYSVNVVGYVNVPIAGGNLQTLVANPLLGSTNGVSTNGAATVLSALQGGETISVWNGSGFYIYNFYVGAKDAGFPSDWGDGGGVPIPGRTYNADADAYFAPEPQLQQGKAFFLQNPGADYTNTFVGSVVLQNTNNPNVLDGGNLQSLVASTVAVSGDIQTNAVINLPLGGGETINVWNGSGFYIYNYYIGAKDAGFPSDWGDGGGVPIPGRVYNADADAYFAPGAPNIKAGEGFFYQNPGSTANWTQNLVLQ